MRFIRNYPEGQFEVIPFGDGVTYEVPVKQPTRYSKLVEIVDMGNGVTYEMTRMVPRK